MSKRKAHHKPWPVNNRPTPSPITKSLLDVMVDGREYGSIVGLNVDPNLEIVGELIRGLNEIATVRKRPCLAYVGNVVKRTDGEAGIDTTDDLPFAEMLKCVPGDQRSVDIFLATFGGSAQQVQRFVSLLRGRFDEVDFLIPSYCMSAGTIFALSGDHIWMTPRACLGPIDPQVPTSQGRFVPAQALLALVDELQRAGEEAMTKNRPIPWTAIRTIDSIDKKELGDAITASKYSTDMATRFISSYKFKHWTTRSRTGLPVTDDHRRIRALEIASALASHERWKSHGHTITRDVLWNEIRLRIDHPEPALERAMTRLWALYHFTFDKTPVYKTILSESYRYIRHFTPRTATT